MFIVVRCEKRGSWKQAIIFTECTAFAKECAPANHEFLKRTEIIVWKIKNVFTVNAKFRTYLLC